MNLDNLIADTADQYKLPVKLVKAIVKVESGGNPWAIRYEPGFYTRYVAGKRYKTFPGCSYNTEGKMRACSFGLMQIMGQVARELGFDQLFLTELCNPATGLDWGCRKLAQQVERYDSDLESAIAAYNAGSAKRNATGVWQNQEYVDKVRKAGGL